MSPGKGHGFVDGHKRLPVFRQSLTVGLGDHHPTSTSQRVTQEDLQLIFSCDKVPAQAKTSKAAPKMSVDTQSQFLHNDKRLK